MVLRLRTTLLAGVLAGTLLAGSAVVVPDTAVAASRKSVVASFYPIAWAAQQVGGDRISVTNLTPAGAEPHDLELTPDQIDEVLDAAVVFELGRGFQPAVEQAAEQRDGRTVELLPRGTSDAHVWLDPVRMAAIVRTVQRELTRADVEGRVEYARNADRVLGELDALDTRYRVGLAHCAREVIVS